MNPWGMLIGAGLGALRAEQEEKNAHKERMIESTKSRWAPFTGERGQNTAQIDHMGRVMQGAAAGAAMGTGGAQGLDKPMAGGGQAGGTGQAMSGMPMNQNQNMYTS